MSLLDALHHHMDAATRWDQKISERVANIKVLYAQQGLGEEHTRRKYELDYDLKDRIVKYQYHCGEVQRYSAMIQGVVAARTFLQS